MPDDILWQLFRTPPTSPDELWWWIKAFLGIEVPRGVLTPRGSSPFDYIWHAYNLKGDCVVWANRWGGKTMNGAIASLLNCLFHDNFQVRILGGSMAQSEKMYHHIYEFCKRPFIREMLKKMPTTTEVNFVNGSRIEILPHSPKAVRGEHVDVLRCDEVDEFRPDVWRAAQFSARIIEKLSTRHKAGGFMDQEIKKAKREGKPIFYWTYLETTATCTRRNCKQCVLWRLCRGRLQLAQGYIPVADVIEYYRRSPLFFEIEMACLEPRAEDAIITEFKNGDPWVIDDVVYSTAPTYRGIDFGHKDPSVCLWVQYLRGENRFVVVDELKMTRVPISVFGAEILRREHELGLTNVVATWGDPSAAMQRHELFNLFNITVLHKRMSKEFRVNAIKELFLLREDGKPRLQICRRCKGLIEEILSYDVTRYSRGVNDDHVEALGYVIGALYSGFTASPAKVGQVLSTYRHRKRWMTTSDRARSEFARIFRLNDPRPFSGGEIP